MVSLHGKAVGGPGWECGLWSSTMWYHQPNPTVPPTQPHGATTPAPTTQCHQPNLNHAVLPTQPQPRSATNPTPTTQCHQPNPNHHAVPPTPTMQCHQPNLNLVVLLTQPQAHGATNPTPNTWCHHPNTYHAVPPTQPQPCGAFMPVSGHAVTPCQPHLLVSAPHPSFLSQCHTAPKSSSFCALSHPHKQCKQVKE